jgi:hypothetical protein
MTNSGALAAFDGTQTRNSVLRRSRKLIVIAISFSPSAAPVDIMLQARRKHVSIAAAHGIP